MLSVNRLIIYIDGSSQNNPGPSGVGVIFESETGKKLLEISKFIGHGTNNQAEYEGLITALQMLKVKHLNWSLAPNSVIIIKTDSALMFNQVNGSYKVRDWTLKKLHSNIMKLKKELPNINLTLIPREENRACDRLAKKAIREMIKSGVVLKAIKTAKAQNLFS